MVIVLAAWFGVSLLFCLAFAAAAARRLPEIGSASEETFEPSSARPEPAISETQLGIVGIPALR